MKQIQKNTKNIIKLGKLEIDLEELRDFIVKAKKNCYAGNGKEIILPDGSKLLTFQKGDFYYEDNYAGHFQAPGRELVKWQNENGQWIWQMTYSGGMTNLESLDENLAKTGFGVLKKALLNVPRDMPFRGPMLFIENDFRYQNKIISQNEINNLIRCKGEEKMTLLEITGENLFFSQDWMAELIIPK